MKIQLLLIVIIFFLLGCSSNQKSTKSETDPKNNNDYYDNGNIRIEKKRLENGDSLWIFKQEDGGCWEENFYHDGEIYKKIVYNSDCTKSAEYELKDGKRHGKWKSYHENGKLREEGNYEMGLEKGIFKYYDETENIIRTEHCFIRDSFIVDFWSPNVQNNDYKEFIEHLKNQKIKYTLNEEKKVAGNSDYHFPNIRTEKSILYFDHLENNEQVKCVRGELNDCSFNILEKICPSNGDGGLLVLTGIDWQKDMDFITIHNLKDQTTYYFELEKRYLKKVHFEPIDIRN